MNKQAPEKPDLSLDGSLEVIKVFPTIQGEGLFAGQPAIFVRLAGCNLQCPLCDTEYTELRERYSAEGLASSILGMARNNRDSQIDLVVITGGEPFRQNLDALVRALLLRQFTVQIETNGTLFQDLPYWHSNLFVICSPKTGTISPPLRPHIRALKYVVKAGAIDSDGLPIRALGHPSNPRVARPWPGFSGKIYVQPADEKDLALNEENTAVAIASCLNHNYALCLQLHKIIGVE